MAREVEFGNARKFNEASYNDNDKFAKDLVSIFLKRKGYKILNDAENYSHDLEVQSDTGEVYFVEVETKFGVPFTDEESFKYDTVSFTGRKKRLHDMQPFIYIIVCKETLHLLACHSNQIYQEKYKEQVLVNSRDRSGLDEFYRVPKHKCKFFSIK